ncbi:MAG: hypothetical protein P1V51_13325 [Deltaproteobacteria bacterium]|nr:hypothetical protein [Deltaproteobacteria bacterium]
MRTLSLLLTTLVGIALGWPLLPLEAAAGAEVPPGEWLEAGRALLLLALPAVIVVQAAKAHLLQDHADNRWATEAGALAWVAASPALAAVAARSTLTTGMALLFGAHLLVVSSHRSKRPTVLAGAGAVLAGALLAHPYLAPAIIAVALHGLFGGWRHLPAPRFDKLSGRAMAGMAGFALPLTAAGLVWDDPIVPDLPALSVDPAPLLAAALGGEGLLLRAPWVLLGLLGLGLWWKRGTRRGFLLVSLGVVAAVLLAALLPTPGAPAAPALLLPLLPFLAGPTARLLSALRDRPGTSGPRSAGLALGLVLAGLLAGLEPAALLTPSLAATPPAGALLGIALILALLLPGRASTRGRLEAAGLSLGVAGLLLAGLHLLGNALG